MNPEVEKNVFIPRSTIDEDWQRFVEDEKIADPEAYLREAVFPFECVEILAIGLSTRCNFDCPFCFNHYSPAINYCDRAEIPGNKVIRMIKANLPVRDVQFAVCGEPLLHKEFFEILDGIAGDVEGIRIASNGSLLTKEVTERLKGYPISWISISAEASDKENYERFRKNGSFADFKRNVAYLQETFPGKVSFSSVLCNDNRDSMLGMPALCRELGGIRQISMLDAVIHPMHRKRGLRKLTQREVQDFMPLFLEECDRHCVTPAWFQRLMTATSAKRLHRKYGDRFYIEPEIYKTPCLIPFENLSIDPEGNYNSCCSVDAKVGDGLNRPFRELFNDVQTRKLRVLNSLLRFPRICTKYCHKIPDPDFDSSIENLRSRFEPLKRFCAKWNPIEHLPAGSRILVWPCGTLTRALLEESYFKNVHLVGLVDGNSELWGTRIQDVPVYSPDQALRLEADAILITTGAFFREIIGEIEQLVGLSSKEIYVIDRDRRLKQRCIPREI